MSIEYFNQIFDKKEQEIDDFINQNAKILKKSFEQKPELKDIYFHIVKENQKTNEYVVIQPRTIESSDITDLAADQSIPQNEDDLKSFLSGHTKVIDSYSIIFDILLLVEDKIKQSENKNFTKKEIDDMISDEMSNEFDDRSQHKYAENYDFNIIEKSLLNGLNKFTEKLKLSMS